CVCGSMLSYIMTRQVVVLLVVLLLEGWAAATFYQDCSDAEVLEVSITDCDIPPCIVPRPSSQHVNITFIPAHEGTILDTVINANIGGVDFPWPGPSGCPLLVQGSCPIQPGQTYKYSSLMPVYAEYPAVSVVVTYKITDENEVNHACIMFPIILV
ncbi:hypothetical protein OTU49_005017, partial [Cherax quadricarinatus]